MGPIDSVVINRFQEIIRNSSTGNSSTLQVDILRLLSIGSRNLH